LVSIRILPGGGALSFLTLHPSCLLQGPASRDSFGVSQTSHELSGCGGSMLPSPKISAILDRSFRCRFQMTSLSGVGEDPSTAAGARSSSLEPPCSGGLSTPTVLGDEGRAPALQSPFEARMGGSLTLLFPSLASLY